MYDSWELLEQHCINCTKCGLSKTRTNVVFGCGNKNADILFVGEGPGRDEDLIGQPFVGAAGKLLDRILYAIGLDRDIVYITNVVKCRPPNNRNPLNTEQQSCLNFLRRQFLLINPKIIVCLGKIAACAIINADFKITAERGIWFERKGAFIIATFHPAALLRDESKKRITWEDFKEIKRKYLYCLANASHTENN